MEHEQELRRLEALRDRKDLDGLERAADEIERKWGHGEDETYFALMLFVCDALHSAATSDEAHRQASLVRKYALLALEKSDAIPLEVEIPLLLHLLGVEDVEMAATSEAWPQRRRWLAKRLFRARQRLEQEMDDDFDFNDVPQTNIMPPPGVNLPSGVSPEDVADPELRSEYEAALEKNSRKAETYLHQRKLRDLKEIFLPEAEAFIVSAYARPPYDLEELKKQLDAFVSDRGEAAKILNAVGRQIPRA